jgi:outer membrane protein TolC
MDVDALTRLARDRRIDLRNVDIQQQLSELSVQSARSSNDPALNLSGSYDRQETEDRFGESVGRPFRGNEKNWAVSATVLFPLFDGGITRTATDRALSNQRSLLLERKSREQEIGVEIQNTVSAILSAEQLYDTAAENLNLAKETLETDRFRYSRGEMTTTDFLRSQLVLFQIKETKNNALLDHFIAQVGLLQSTQSLTLDAVDELVGEGEI